MALEAGQLCPSPEPPRKHRRRGYCCLPRAGGASLLLLLGLLGLLVRVAASDSAAVGFVSPSGHPPSSRRSRVMAEGPANMFLFNAPAAAVAAANGVAAAGNAAAAANGAGKRVAVLGAGAAGLVASRLLREAGFGVRCFERTGEVGGVWRYRPQDVMYRSLVTNLPKEIMAYLDMPFDASLPSFLGHAQVQAYLEAYAQRHHLSELVSFNTEVRVIRPVLPGTFPGDPSRPLMDADLTEWREPVEWDRNEEMAQPRWRVGYTRRGQGNAQGEEGEGGAQEEVGEEDFDAVVVCNGHYELPYTPPFPGLRECYRGRVLHSRNYDQPGVCAGLRVLCVGYKSSGTDIAREIAAVAKEVHVVDRRVQPQGQQPQQQQQQQQQQGQQQQEQELQRGNIFRRPELVRFLEDGASVEFADGSVLGGVDLVLVCTGYEYHIPFLFGGTTGPLQHPVGLAKDKGFGTRLLRVEDRAVFPLYQHLFHARFPSLSFMGLPHSVVPFPLFELQARWIAQQLAGQSRLPSRKERFAWVDAEKARQRGLGRKPRDYFYMGAEQWPYLRMMAQAAGCLTPQLEEELTAREGIYNDVSRRRPAFPGADDAYRRCEYRILPGGQFEVDASKFVVEQGKEAPVSL